MTASPTSILFARGVVARLQTWPILSIAVQESWGGPSAPSKRTWLAGVIVDAFEESSADDTPDDQYIEELLLQVMQDEFDVDLQDGSAETVSVDIVRLWEECRLGRDGLVKRFEAMADGVKGKKIEAPVVQEVQEEEGEWESDEGEEDGEDEDVQMAPALIDTRKDEPEVDQDGFTLVKGKGKGRR